MRLTHQHSARAAGVSRRSFGSMWCVPGPLEGAAVGQRTRPLEIQPVTLREYRGHRRLGQLSDVVSSYKQFIHTFRQKAELSNVYHSTSSLFPSESKTVKRK